MIPPRLHQLSLNVSVCRITYNLFFHGTLKFPRFFFSLERFPKVGEIDVKGHHSLCVGCLWEEGVSMALYP